MAKKKNIRAVIRKIPGYGSGRISHMMSATLGYVVIIIVLFLFIVKPFISAPGSVNQDDVIPLATEWIIVLILAILAIYIHYRNKKAKK